MNYFKILKIEKQTTLKNAFTVIGRSIIENKRVVVRCKPAKSNTGIVFLFKNILIQAIHSNVKKNDLHTTVLGFENCQVLTVEHLLSAFYGLGVDNVVVEIKGDSQLPLLDGSSYVYAKKIKQSGLKVLSAKRGVLKIVKPLLIKSKINGGFAFFLPNQLNVFQVMIDFPNLISQQEIIFNFNPIEYYKKISKARTFFIKPFSNTRWRLLKKQIKGLPVNPKDSNILTYDKNSFMSALRYDNEPVRHKALDFLGDIALLGYRFQGKIIIYKPGHAFTFQIIKKIINIIND